MLIERTYLKNRITEALEDNPVVMLLGMRQSGKTTLARQIAQELRSAEQPVHYFDLEHPQDFQACSEPAFLLEPLQGTVIIDECQRKPELFPLLRVLADRPNQPARFLLLGSASRHLLQQGSESLAGRIKTIYVQGFGVHEVAQENHEALWIRGGMPRSFLAPSDAKSFERRSDFLSTFLGRDLMELGARVPSAKLMRFWQMAAHYHGQTWNSSDLACSLDMSPKTINHYRDLLTDAMVVRQLMPYYTNTKKRVVKSPKFYIRDSGLFHALMNIRDRDTLLRHPKLGASWEGFALEQVFQYHHEMAQGSFFAVHSEMELDLVMESAAGLIGFEFKFSDAPSLTSSMTSAMNLLNLDRLYVVYPGQRMYGLRDNIIAVPLSHLWETLGWKA